MEDCHCKLVLVGDGKSGKTALVNRFISDTFLEPYIPTGFEKYPTVYEMRECRVHFTIWDTSGAAAYDTVRPLAYQDANVFLLCFAISNPESLENTANKWYPELRQQCPNVPVILCGCQSDLRNDTETIYSLGKLKKSPVTAEQALTVSRHIGAITYVETSSKLCAQSVRDAFEVAALAALGKLNKNHFSIQRHRSFAKIKCKSRVDLKELKGKARNCVIM